MNYLKGIASFILSLTLLNSPLWCMERDTSIEKSKIERGRILSSSPHFNNLFLFMYRTPGFIPEIKTPGLIPEIRQYIANFFFSLLIESALVYNFELSKTLTSDSSTVLPVVFSPCRYWIE